MEDRIVDSECMADNEGDRKSPLENLASNSISEQSSENPQECTDADNESEKSSDSEDFVDALPVTEEFEETLRQEFSNTFHEEFREFLYEEFSHAAFESSDVNRNTIRLREEFQSPQEDTTNNRLSVHEIEQHTNIDINNNDESTLSRLVADIDSQEPAEAIEQIQSIETDETNETVQPRQLNVAADNDQDRQSMPNMVDVKVTVQECIGTFISVSIKSPEIKEGEEESTENANTSHGEAISTIEGSTQATEQSNLDSISSPSVSLSNSFSETISTTRPVSPEYRRELEHMIHLSSQLARQEHENDINQEVTHINDTIIEQSENQTPLETQASDTSDLYLEGTITAIVNHRLSIHLEEQEILVNQQIIDSSERDQGLTTSSGQPVSQTSSDARRKESPSVEAEINNPASESPEEIPVPTGSSFEESSYNSSGEWQAKNEDSTSDSTPDTTRSDIQKEESVPDEEIIEPIQNKKEKPTITILNEAAQSILDDYENELFPIPGYDLERDGDTLLKELDREMSRKIYENTDGMFSQPTAQSNYRMYIPKTEFIAMDDFFNQYSEENLDMDLSDAPTQMTEEERALFEAMSDEDKRNFRWNSVVDELLETEESYTRDLYVLCTYFFKVLQNVKYITQEEKYAICRNGDTIAKDQESFCDSLRTAVIHDKDLQSVRHLSGCFIKAEAYFEAYFDYSMRQDDAITVYNKLLKTDRKFRDLDRRLHLFHRISWGKNRLKFEDYLIMPFQRLFRYKLLLQSIRKATSSNIDGYELLEVAENIIHRVATKINNSKAKTELETKSEVFLSRLQGNWGIFKKWYRYFGSCSLIGTLEMRYLPKQRASKRVCCALFERYLILVKPKKTDVYEPKQWFPIREFTVQDLVDMPNSINFPWLLRNSSHIFEFSAASQAEKNVWMTSMTNCIENSRKSYAESKVESNEYLVEHLFTSSLNSRDATKPTETSPKADLEHKLTDCIALPQGSASLSQSAIFDRPSRSVNRLSIPSFSSMFPASDSLQSPTSGRYLLKGALSDRFVNYKLKQFKVRCDVFDSNFKDVYTSCLMTSKGCFKKKAI